MSAQFSDLTSEGLSLVEAVAAYLDGEGRKAARGLAPAVSVTYATESMRLTTRLLDVASWLAVVGAFKSEQISQAEAAQQLNRVRLSRHRSPAEIDSSDGLPAGLVDLIARTASFTERLVRIAPAINDRIGCVGQPMQVSLSATTGTTQRSRARP